MNDIVKIMEINAPLQEPLFEPYPFKLAKSRLQIQTRKVFYSITPNDMRLWAEKAPTCGPTERLII